MHRFSWRMATIQMRLMLHREQSEEWMCVSSWTLHIAKHHSAALFTQTVCDVTPFVIPWCIFFVYVSVLLQCIVHSRSLSHSCHLFMYVCVCECVYIVCLLRKKVVVRTYSDADRALNPAVLVAPVVCFTPPLMLQPCSCNYPSASLSKEDSTYVPLLVNKPHVQSQNKNDLIPQTSNLFKWSLTK